MDIALEAKAWGGDDGLKEVRAAHNALTKAGLAFEPDPKSTSAPGVWRDADGDPAPRARVLALLREGETAAGFTFDNVLRRDRVTGKHLLPGDRETKHDTMTGVTSPFWAPRKGPEFTDFVTRVFGGAPETGPAAPVKLADSASAQPAGQAQGGNNPVDPEVQSGDTSSSDSKKEEIEWVPEPTQFEGERRIKVKGPVRIDVRSGAAGLDGLDYRVQWHPLDKDGNVIPTFRNPEKEKSFGEYSGFSIPIGRTHQPPNDHPHGFEVRIWIPPQPPRHGNTAGGAP